MLAHDTDVWEVRFYGGETGRIIIEGDGDTDLDFRIYDENGRLLASDLDDTDWCNLSIRPRWTQDIRIEIRNLGDVYNRYTIVLPLIRS